MSKEPANPLPHLCGNQDTQFDYDSTGRASPKRLAISPWLACRFVSMREIRELRGPVGLPVERDIHLDADKTLSAYADEARVHGRIVS